MPAMTWRRSRVVWRVVAIVLALLAVALLTLLGQTLYDGVVAFRGGQVSTAERTIPDTDVNPYGANFFLGREVEPWKVDKTLQMARDAGLGWVKLQFPWEQLEPRKGEFLNPQTRDSTWDKYDRIVASCEQYNLEIVARLDRPPDWTRQDNSYKQAPPDDLADYGDFVYAFVSHYKGRIHYVQIWNEPNIFPEWGNRPVDPEGYTELLKIAYRRAKEADPDIRVLSAPLAITLGEPHPEPGKWRSMNDLAYLEAMYAGGAAGHFDIYSANAFGLQFPPDDPPDPDVLNFQRVVLHREIMERYGDAAKAVWFNEYGWNASPEDMSPERLIWQRVSEQEQSDYTLRGIQKARDEWPWAGVFMIWYFRQVGNIPPDDPEYYFRMVDPDFTPRQVYLAVQDAAQQLQEAGQGVVQEMNAAAQHYGAWEQVTRSEAGGQSALRSDTPGDSVTLSFRGQSVDLITRTGPDGARLVVTLDGRAVSGLARDETGQSYVSLYSKAEKNGAAIPLVRDSSLGSHTLRITVSQSTDLESTGREAVIDAFAVRSGKSTSASLLPSLAGLAALVVCLALLLYSLRRLGILSRRR
jgi:hypothetical protein